MSLFTIVFFVGCPQEPYFLFLVDVVTPFMVQFLSHGRMIVVNAGEDLDLRPTQAWWIIGKQWQWSWVCICLMILSGGSIWSEEMGGLWLSQSLLIWYGSTACGKRQGHRTEAFAGEAHWWSLSHLWLLSLSQLLWPSAIATHDSAHTHHCKCQTDCPKVRTAFGWTELLTWNW